MSLAYDAYVSARPTNIWLFVLVLLDRDNRRSYMTRGARNFTTRTTVAPPYTPPLCTNLFSEHNVELVDNENLCEVEDVKSMPFPLVSTMTFGLFTLVTLNVLPRELTLGQDETTDPESPVNVDASYMSSVRVVYVSSVTDTVSVAELVPATLLAEIMMT